MYVALDDWLRIIADEYLGTFIPAGGAAVKFAITTPPIAADDVRRGLETAADHHDLLPLFVDAATTRIHFIDQLFHSVAAQIDWDGLAAVLMRRLLAADGFVL